MTLPVLPFRPLLRLSSTLVVTLSLMGALSGCFLFEDFYNGPYPCEDNSHCPTGSCVDGLCAEEDTGQPCNADQDCPTDSYCNSTALVCGDGNVFEGDFVVNNSVDMDALLPYHRIRGSILIGPDSRFDGNPIDKGVTTVDLPRLVSVGGLHVANQASLEHINLPALRRHGNDGIQIENNAILEDILFPVLNDADNITISLNPELQEIRMDAVVRLAGFGGGSLDVSECPALEILNLPNLEFANLLSLSELGTLAGPNFVLNMPNLDEIGILLAITSSPTLESLQFPNLTTVGGAMIIIDLEAMTTFSAPSLATVEGDFNFSNHPAISSLTLPSLTVVGGDVSANYNYLLSDCDLVTLFEDVAVGGTVDISDNAFCE